jgi:hypothetical protein
MVLCVMGTGTVSAQPLIPDVPVVPSPQEIIDELVLPPVFPSVSDPPPPVASLPPESGNELASVQDFYAAIMPRDVGDPFFDYYPPDLAEYANGEVIEQRDVTATAGPFVLTPVSRVTQFKFRTDDANGQSSFATATLVIPSAPWRGEGSRPVVVNNLPIDSLGRECTPGYTMSKGLTLTTNPTDYVPPVTPLATARGYAVLIPDHQGPRMAYAEPRTAGKIVLDSIRATRSLGPEFSVSRYGMTGYSGGAIATNGAAKLIDSYAPELGQFIVGAALGGTPIDDEVLVGSMAGNPLNFAKGLLVAAAYGIARENPEVLTLINGPARMVAPLLRGLCTIPVALLGVLPIPVELLANTPDPFNSPLAREIYARMKLEGVKYGTPMYVYNGAQEFWIPSVMARELYAEQCELGVSSVLRLPFGEHGIAAVAGLPEALAWLDARLQGIPAVSEC